MGSGSSEDWRDGFLFLGNHLALDFLNTLPLIDGARQELLPDTGSLVRWLAAAGLIDPAAAKRLRHQWAALPGEPLRPLWNFRESLRKSVLWLEEGALPSAAFVREMNAVLLAHPIPLQLRRSGDSFEAAACFQPAAPRDMLAPLAGDVVSLLTTVDPSRLRQCQTCVLHFYDASKKGTRVWCSMNLCGNRAKVAAYSARKRSALSAG